MLIASFIRQLQLFGKQQLLSPSRKLHGHLLKSGSADFRRIRNGLVDAYGKCGQIEDAHQLFDETPGRDHVSWASILSAYNQASLPKKTLAFFNEIFQYDQLQPDHFVYASLVKACTNLCAQRQGKQVHAHFISSPFLNDDVVKSSLVDMYSKCGLPKVAFLVFDSIFEKTSVCWTAMLSGYAKNGFQREAVDLFSKVPIRNLYAWTALISGLVQSGHGVDGLYFFIEMRNESVDIVDPLLLPSVVGACSDLALLDLGKQVHGLVICLGYTCCLFTNNALVDMYAKCSDISSSKEIFDRMIGRDVVSWNSMIVGVAQHGRADEALHLYEKMLFFSIKPNEVTFVGLLYACSHAGLVRKGRELFKSMVETYRIAPSMQHYTCLLDLLGRSGNLEEAENVITTMPFQPDEPTWVAFLSSCKNHGYVRLGLKFADQLLSSNPKDPSTHVLLSNLYAGEKAWERVSSIRNAMASMNVKTELCYSFIELGRESQIFHFGEIPLRVTDDMHGFLKELDSDMRRRGYVPDTSSVLLDMEEHEKESQLFWHSERLAVAYGLLRAAPGRIIRVVKNIRVCRDCHVFFKFLSDAACREIIIRDATRYHHFNHGRCSCNDFW